MAWSYLAAESAESGRALPFSILQQRLGRKKVSREMMRRVPVAYLVFDLLYAGGELLIDRPLRERAKCSTNCWQFHGFRPELDPPRHRDS